MKKMENFFRRALSMLMCICMLTGNVGGALAEVPTPLSGNNASLIATSEENSVVDVAMEYEGITLQGYYDQTLPYEEKANASAPYAAYYLIDVSVAGIMQEAKIAFNHGFDADGAPVIELRSGDAATAVSWVDGNIVLNNDTQLAGDYQLLVGVPLKDSAVASLLEGGSVTSTLTASNSASETIALNPQVSLTQEEVGNYNKWTLTYTCKGIQMYNTGFTAKVDNGTIYDYSGNADPFLNNKLTTTACGKTINGRQSKTDSQTLVFDHETDYHCVSCFDTNFKAEFYSSAETTPVICSVALQPEKVGVEWDIAASSAEDETLYKSGRAVVIDGEKCIQWTIKVDNVAKGVPLTLVDALTETELLVDNNHPFVITGQKNETQYAKDNNELNNNSITKTDSKNLTVRINREIDGVGTVVVTYYTSVAKTNVNREDVESYFEQNTANIQNAATLNSVDVSNSNTQKITSVNAKVNDNVKTLMVTLKTQNKTDGSAIEIKTNEPKLYIAALDASGNLTKPVELKKVSGSNSEFKAGFMYEAQNGTEPVVLLSADREKDSAEVQAAYVYYNGANYKAHKLSDILYLDVDGDGNSTVYPRDFFAIEEMTESNGALNITLTNDEQTGLEGLAEAYKGNLYINTVKDEFTKHTHTELPAYYDDTNYLGVAGNFHIVAFGKAELNTHCNGNILAHELVAGSNFGTNGYPFEVSYIQKYSGVASTSASSENHLLVLGSYNDLSLSGKNDELNVTYDVNGKKIDTPDHIMIDVDTDTAPFIDLAAVESEIESRSSGLLGEDGGVSVIAANDSKRYTQFILNSPDSTGYLNLTAGELNAMSDLPVRLEGFKGGHVGTMVINVNCAGVGEVKMPSEACIFVDGVQQGTGEVTVFTNGRVIWNFYNEENTKITTSGAMTGMVVAPQATIDVAGNVNGTVVGHNIKVTRESHRTDFKGTITSAVINFSARKYVDNQDPGDKKFTFVLEEKLGDEWTEIAETTNNGTSITFPDIEYSKTGEHEYRIREEGMDGYVCDKSEYYIRVKVTSTQVGADTRYWPEYTYYSDENHQNKLTGPESFRFNNQTTSTDDKTSVRGKKVWDDNNNADGVRPAQVEIVLLQDGVEYARTYANQASSWQWSFVGLPKSTDGQEHVYTVSEMPVGKYTTQITKDENSNNEFTITNTHRSTKVSIDVTKRWEGDNTHPDNVVIKLYKYDVNTGLRMVEPLDTVTLNTNNNWHHQFTDLPKFENNIEIRYEVVEDSLEGYDTEITLDSKVDAADGSGDVSYTYTVKNKYTGQKTETCRVGFLKIWKGDDESQRPTSIEITLKRWTNGVWGTTDPTFKMTQKVTEEMGWEYYWKNLPMYVSGDQQYYYYVEETPIPNYKVSCYYGDAKSHNVKEYIEMTNTYQQSTKAELHKEWGNENIEIPENLSLYFKLYREANGTKSYVLDVNVRYENGNWVCDNPGFATIEAEGDNKGFHLVLTRDWSSDTLPMDDGQGNAYTYTFEEEKIELNYENLTGQYEIQTSSANNVTRITNTAKTIAKKDVTVTKEWEHGSNPEEYRPTSVQVTLKRWRQGEGNDLDYNFSMGPVTLSEGNWSHNWTGLEEGYLKGDGSLQQYYYFVEETGADGYKAEITRDADNIYNLKLKNTYDDSKKKLTVEKVWVGDPGSHDVWVELRAKTTTNGDEQVGSVCLNNSNDWSYQWTDLPTVVNNQEVDYYYVKEITSIYGYTTSYGGDCVEDNGNYKVVFGAGNRANVTITNAKMEYVSVKLNKVWDDAGFESERPYRLEFELWRKTENGTPERLCDNVAIYCDNGTWKCDPGYATFSVNDNGWSFEFSYYNNWDGNKMPANDANNNPYTYYFVEKEVRNNSWQSIIDQYEVTYEQNNNYETTVTNQRGDKTVDIPVVKVWNDTALEGQDAEHADITLQLVANGTDEQGKTIVLPIKNEDGTIKVGEDGNPIWSYTFENLPEKDADKNVITYTVREINVPENYVNSYGTDDQGNLVVTNTYVAPVEAQIEATKTLIGKDLEAGMFTFQLFSSVTNPNATEPEIPMPDGASAVTSEYADGKRVVGFANTVTNGEYVSDAEKETNPNDWQSKVVFPYISYKLSDMKGEDGVISTSKTFTYSIQEIPDGESDIIYDKTSYDVVVTVGYDSNRKTLSITSITYDNKAAKPEFKNTYVTSTNAKLSATKELTGKQLTADAFTFELAAVTAGAPMPSSETAKNDANGNITFGDITYTLSDMKESDGSVSKEKTFTYTIKELGADGNGITIDKTVFYADVTVTMGDDGKLTASAPVYYTDVATNPVAAAKFTNTYTTAPAELTISVDKKLADVPEGQMVDVAGKFTFTLSAKTENAPMPDDKEAKNAENENSFGKITFNAPDTYTYTVTETGEVAGVVNGEAKEFTFTVEDDGKGNLVIKEATEGKYTVEYKNTYEVRNISVTKEWEGRDDGKYPVSVQVTLNADDAAVAGEGITNPVTLNEDNQWNYTWSNLPKYTDSTGKVEIKYTVVESGLAAGYTGETTGDMNTGFTITNTYSVESTTVSFPVKKVLEVESGTGLKEAKNFTFELSAVDGAPVPATTTLNIDLQRGEKTDTFGPITYTAAGTYTYTIKETSTVRGVTNDADATIGKTVKVTVEDNGDGTLTATADSTEENPVTFTNTYKAGPAEAAIAVKKVLAGVPADQPVDITGMFTFELKDANDTVLQSKKNAADGNVTFDKITYDTVGTYTYTVTESGDVANISNDTTVKTVTVTVVDNGDGTMTATADSTAVNPFEFTNTYVEPIKAELKATKTVTGEGKPALEADQFTFELYEGENKIGEAKNAADGTVTFELEKEFTLSDAGKTFTYTIKESNENAIAGFKYDESVWTAEVTITLTSEKKLDYVVTYTKSDGTNTNQIAAEFVNQYEKTELSGKKIWVDENNQYQNRPVMISVDLYRDGEKIATVEPELENTNTNEWTWTIKDLDKYVDNKEVTYTAEEVPVSGYTTTQEGNNFTNTLKRINVPVEKKWEDDGNSEGFRPAQIELQLVKGTDKTPVGEAVIVKAVNGEWKHTFENLPEYEKGQKIVYSVVETEVAHYDTKVERDETTGALTVTNSREPEKVTVAVKKVWDDADNQDGERPTELKVTLSNGQFVTLSESNNWEAKIENLPKYADGKEITYTWTEDTLTDGYTLTNTTTDDLMQDDVVIGTITTLTNKRDIEKTEVKVVKVWSDNNDQDGLRPDAISVQLLADGVAQGAPVTLNESNSWSHSFGNLDVNKDGVAIVYSVKEISKIDGYTTTAPVTTKSSDGDLTTITITNTHETAEISIVVKKVWEDANNQDGIRDTNTKVTVQLTADGQNSGNPVELSETNNWTYTFNDLPAKADGKEIEYAVVETAVPEGYNVSYSKNGTEITVTNTHTPATTEATVKKVWSDANNQDGKRPTSLVVTLSNGQSVTLNEDNKWTGTITGLPKYAAGQEIIYTWTEATLPEGYTLTSAKTEGTVTTLTNSYTPEETEATVTKVWDDANDQDGKRPEELTVTLFADGESTNQSVTLNEANLWTDTITGLPKYAAGHEITYTWTEDEEGLPEGYTLSGTSKEGTVTTLTNSYTPEVTKATVIKAWDDAEDQDGIRPDDLTVALMNGETVVEEVTLTAAKNWTATVENLPKYAAGVEIAYTWSETDVLDGYELTGNVKEGIITTITNKHETELTEATVKKVWEDATNQDGKRPTELKVTLSDGTEVTLNEGNGWTATVKNLPKYAAGKEITYTWTENEAGLPEGYTLTNKETEGTITTLTNSYTPETTEAMVKKVWDDADDQDGIRPGSLTVALMNGETKVQDVTLTAAENWTKTIGGLAKYAAGVEIEYTWTEGTLPEGYTLKSNETVGTITTITNTHETATTEAKVIKVWEDDSNRDHKRPETLTVTLSNGQTVTLSESNHWTDTITGLPKYAAGEEIEYTWTEATLPKGYTLKSTNTVGTITTITNSYTIEKVDVAVEKEWDDNNNQDGMRTSIDVELRADSGIVENGTATLSQSNNWSYKWEDLPKYNNGVQIVYTVAEKVVPDGYTHDTTDVTSTVDEDTGDVSIELTNHHEPETTEVEVTKVWNDAENQDGKRPTEITYTLWKSFKADETENTEGTETVADGEETKGTFVKSVTKKDTDDSWNHTFDNLPVYEGGKELVYTVTETVTAEGYTSKVTDDAKNGFTVTNSYTPETTEITATKVWNDASNQDGKRPDKITFELYANGEKVDGQDKILTGTGNSWTVTWTGLDKYYDGGKPVVYTVNEIMDPTTEGYGYKMSVDGLTITNTYKPETVNVSVIKDWQDNNDQDGKRPDTLTINLLKKLDGETAEPAIEDTVELPEENSWSKTWEKLPKFENGKLIIYTVEEVTTKGDTTLPWVADYDRGEPQMTTDGVNNYKITNTHTPEKTFVTVTKVWDDKNDQDGKRPTELTVTLSNGTETVKTVTLKKDNSWTATVNDLPMYADGKLITYTWTEGAMPEGYSLTESKVENGTDEKGISGTITTITNSYSTEETSATIRKVWNDANDQDGLRPESLVVTLSNGTEVTLNEENYWTATIDKLPKYADGVEIEYTWTEGELPEGYTLTDTSVNGTVTTLTNSHTPEKTEATVVKVWDDEGNQDGKRPTELTVTLSNGTKVTLNEGNRWTAKVENLPKYKDGVEIIYTWTESALPEGYTLTNTDKEGTVTTLTNSYVPEQINIDVVKVWDDAENQDGKRPESIYVQLYANGEAYGEPVELTDDNLTASWPGLDKCKAGTKITYTVKEGKLNGAGEFEPVGEFEDYTATIGALTKTNVDKTYQITITNKHIPELTSATVKKVWEDEEDQDGKRPETLKVTLSDGTEVELNEGNGWSATIENLPKYADGELITYTWTEEDLPEGYELTDTSVSGTITTLTNSHTPEETEATVVKVWDDAENQDGKRPTVLTVTLSDGTEVELNEGNGWTATVENLPKYADGEEIEYTWTEGDMPEGYELTDTSVNGTITTLTNSYDTENTVATVKKVWNDKNNQDGIRPNELKVTLSNGTEVTLNEGNGWSATVEDLPKYANGQKINYTWTESGLPEGYELTDTSVSGTITTLTNTHETETTEVKGTKEWVDGENQDNIRPESITVKLLADGEQVKQTTVEPNESGVWSWEFTGLDKYKAGEVIVYTVTEETIDGYVPTQETNDDGSITLINTHKPAETEATVKKVWDDADDQDGKRPAELKVTLSNGTEVTLNEGNKWTATVENLPKYNKGVEIEYTWTEGELPEGYTLTNTTKEGTITTLTNSHTPELIDLTIIKVWNDGEDQDGIRPNELKVTLSNGTEVTLNEGNKWTAKVENLPKYENGEEIEYTWTEGELPEGYTLTDTSVNGYVTTLTNTHVPAVTEATVLKVWEDEDDQDGKRPKSLKVTLSNGTEVTLNEGNKWTATINNLPMYADGELITYTWTEEELPEGYVLVSNETEGTITTITNKHDVEMIQLTVKKVWDDAKNQDGKRPNELKVNLSNGTETVDTVTLNQGNLWTAYSVELPKYADGKLITYTWTEVGLPAGYTLTSTVVEGTITTLTNSHVPEKTEATVKKVWDDANNQDGKRPEDLTVTLKNGDTDAGVVTLNEGNNWTGKIDNLPKYANGTEIQYTWTEGDMPEGYELTGSAKEGTVTTLTNSYDTENTAATVKKVWNDANDQDGLRPESLEVTLSNGTKVTLSEANQWTATINDLPKFANGTEIQYSWTEGTLPDGYELTGTAKEGTITTLTNTHVPAITEFTVNKVWEDAENQDGIRPTSILVQLYADGDKYDEAVKLEGYLWSYTWDNLPMNNDGEAIVYTVNEVDENGNALDIPGYTKKIEGGTITNTHVPETTSVKVTKIWNDSNNQDGIRPEEIAVQLLKDNQPYGEAKVLSLSANKWTATWTDLPKLRDQGTPIVYTVVEGKLVEEQFEETEFAGYTTTVSDDLDEEDSFEYEIINAHTPGKVSISGTKTWDDADNQDGIRPTTEGITINLLANGTKVKSETVYADANGNWSWNFTDLPEKANGQAIAYTITEDKVEGYETTVSGYNVTNTHVPEKTKVEGTKTWEDAQNQDGIRPDSITINLLANGTKVDSQTVTKAEEWKWSFTGLAKYKAGQEITYTITEEPVSGYTPTIDGFDVTNTHTPGKVTVSGTKTWDDADNQDGKRPGSITIRLLADGKEVRNATVSADNAGNWSYSFTDLPEKANGKTIVYTITEDAVTGYETKVDGYNVTNTHKPEKTKVEGSKTWEDAQNQDGKRPGSITINLLANGTKVASKTVYADANGNWSWEFTGLDKYKAGTEIVYTVTEEAITGYVPTQETNDDGSITLINTHVPAETEATVKKVWDDAKNQDGKRPAELKVTLSNGTEVTLNEANSWTATVEHLPKYNKGVEIEYTWTEGELPEGYALTNTTKEGTITTLTNTHVPEKVDVEGSKTWNDAGNQDGKRPASITINLLANGEVIKTVSVTEADGWKWSFTDLDKYADGEEIVYTITEDEVEYYKSEVDGYNVTNTHEPEKTKVEGIKTWYDAGNQDGKRPASITIRLLADGKEVASKTVTEANGWKWSFTGLAKYKAGNVIAYTITEDAVTDYTTKVTGYDVENSYTPGTTSVTVSKSWNDDNNRDGVRPASITFNLLANGTVVKSETIRADEDGNWPVVTFANLPIYEVGKVGSKITYTVTEDEVEDYTTTFTGDAETGFVFTNTHTNEKTLVEGSKTWNDNENQDGKRPASITINLLADGTKVDSKTVTKDDGWKWSFTELNKYRDHGVAIVYTITEDKVDDYTASINGYDVTNTHVPEKVDVEGSKTWEDAENQDGKRPASITIRLLANGTEVDSKTVTESEGWSWSFTELDKYADGEEIEYTITEDEVEYYESEVDGYNVTNTHEPEKVDVEGIKTWNDAENQDGKRPESITVNLLADGEQVKQTTVKPNESGVWSWEFTDLDKYKAGELIDYTVTEEAIDGYVPTQEPNDDGSITLINTHTPAETEATVKKVWDDAKNQDGKRPAELKVTLSNGAEVTLNEANSWTAKVEHLPKYNKGVEIEYTWTEGELPEGYALTNTTKEGTITTLTNTHVPEKVDVEGSKTWNDAGNQDGKRPASITINLLANGTKVASKTVTKDDEWKWSFTGLDKYKAGTEIAYTITEDAVADYETKVDGYDVTNTHVPEKVKVEGIKTWNDANNQDGKRPESIKIHLFNGETVINTVIVNEECGWKWSFTDLPKYRPGAVGVEIKYSIVEELDQASAAAYSMTIDGYNVTNTHDIETVDITGAKTWIDLNDKYLKRPDSVTIRLLADGEEIDSRQVTEADNWSWTFKDLPKYKAGQVGQEITYSIKEDVVTGYITTVNDFNVTNTMNLVEFIKTDEQTGKRLPGAKFALYEGPMGSYDPAKPVETWVSTADTKILAGLKVGQTYTIVETEAPSGYAMMVPFQFTVQLTDIPGTYRAFSVSNCHVYRFRKLDSATNGLVHGAHLAVMDANNNIIDSWWSSGDNNGWHEIVDSKLVAGKDYKLVELESPWGYELADPITFSIDEDDGMLFINGSKSMKAELVMYDEPWPEVTPTPEPTETSFTVTKRWEDKDNVLGLRPSSITVHLYRKLRTEAEYPTTPFMTVQMASNGTDTWRFTFDDLPRRSADGVLYDYTVQEVPVDGYVVSYRNNGKTIVNSIPEEDFPPTPTPTLPYVTPTPSPMPRVPAGVQFVDGEWMYIDEYGIPLGGIPLTGDNTNFVLWGMAIGLPLLVAALAAVEIRRRKKLLLAAEDEDEVEETEA